MHPERLLAAIMLVSLTLGAGLQVNREHLRAVLRDIGLLGRVLLANFIIVPILGVLIAKALRLPPEVATGFLLMAIAPAAPFVLLQVRKRGGSLGLAVALEFFLPLLSVVTVPVTAALVLPTEATARLPIDRFMLTLVLFQLLPLIVGIVAAAVWPALPARLGRPLQLIFLVSIVALVVVLAPRFGESVASVYGSHGMWAMLLLVIPSLAVGWALGGPAREDRRELGIGTALRNIGLCAVIATSSFGTPLVAAAVLTYFLIQFIVTTAVGGYLSRTAEHTLGS